MKKKNLKYVLIAGLTGLIALSISVYSCEKEVITPNSTSKAKPDNSSPKFYCGKTRELKLVGENGAIMGSAVIFNDTKYFYVNMKSYKDFMFGDAAMHVASRPEGIPVDQNRNPAISEFEYKIKGQALSTNRSIIIPLSSMKGLSYVAVNVQAKALHSAEKHAMFISTWVDGRQFGNTVKGRLFTYEKQECLTNEGVSDDQLTER